MPFQEKSAEKCILSKSNFHQILPKHNYFFNKLMQLHKMGTWGLVSVYTTHIKCIFACTFKNLKLEC